MTCFIFQPTGGFCSHRSQHLSSRTLRCFIHVRPLYPHVGCQKSEAVNLSEALEAQNALMSQRLVHDD
jgi:hypothetical protein